MEPYYDDGRVVIYHADCADVLPSVSPQDVSLVLTDPPYGIDLDTDYAGRMHLSDKSRRWQRRVDGDASKFDPTSLLAYGKVVLFGANYYADALPLGGWLVWRKRGVSPVLSDCELAWHNCGGKRVSFFETAHVNTTARDGKLHPTQKPVDLMRWIVEKFTDPGDLVLDPYMGSGPVARACADLGRRYVGIELVEEYVMAAVGRLGQQSLDLDASSRPA